LLGTSLKKLAERSLKKSLIEASLGMAALNALLPIPDLDLPERNAQDLILEKGRGKNVAIVGEFPFIKKIRSELGTLNLIQESPNEGFKGVEQAAKIFPHMDVIATSGSSLINHTFQPLIESAQNAYIIVLGATTPLSPILFEYGVNAVCGSCVTAPDLTLAGLTQGSPFRTLPGIRRITWLKD